MTAPRADLDELGRLLAEATSAGDWRAVEGDLEGGTLNDYIATLLTNRQNDATTTGRLFMTLAPNDIDPERGAEVVPALTGDGPRAEANAALIAALVNAAPALLAEVAELRETVARVEALADEFDAKGRRGSAHFGADIGDTIRLWIDRDPRAALDGAR